MELAGQRERRRDRDMPITSYSFPTALPPPVAPLPIGVLVTPLGPKAAVAVGGVGGGVGGGVNLMTEIVSSTSADSKNIQARPSIELKLNNLSLYTRDGMCLYVYVCCFLHIYSLILTGILSSINRCFQRFCIRIYTEDLRAYFDRFGRVIRAEVMYRDRQKTESRRFGFISYAATDTDAVARVLGWRPHVLNGLEVSGLRVYTV